jgi:GNAT superfamily N-acetyltransferase
MNIILRQLSPTDAPFFSQGIELIKKTQGEFCVHDQHLNWFTSSADCCVFGAFADQRLVAVATGGILPNNQHDFYRAFSTKIAQILEKGPVGTLLFIAVDPAFRKQGLARRLVELRLEWFKQKKISYALTVSWNPKVPNTSSKIFERMNFEKVSHFSNYIASGAPVSCPYCGTKCHCESFVFIKKIV